MLEVGQEWETAAGEFRRLCVGLKIPTTTGMITVNPQPISEADALRFASNEGLDRRFASVIRTKESGAHHLYTYQVRIPGLTGVVGTVLWLDPHSHISAWLVINAWRIRQLADQAARSFAEYELVAGGVLTRALVEAAAALSSDIERLTAAWSACRTHVPTPTWPVSRDFTPLQNLSAELLGGGKFKTDDFKPITDRRNVLTSVERLAKRGIASLAVEYDWLCNLAHPSFAAMFAFAGPLLTRGSDGKVHYAERPLEAFPDDETIDDTITSKIRRGASQSLRLATIEFDRGVRLLDDIGLTTKAPQLAATDYWRRLVAGGRNDRCPCRSGRKVKVCRHEWGSSYVEWAAEAAVG